MTNIVRARTLGAIQNSLPQPGPGGDAGGLAAVLNDMISTWNNGLKGALGFNNQRPQELHFSLRAELFRISPGSAGNLAWRQTLSSFLVPNLLELPEFNRYCIYNGRRDLAQPAIVAPFNTTISQGANFFVQKLAAGDNTYPSGLFSVKVRGVNVRFSNYSTSGGNGLINTPYVYLVPVGNDRLRTPGSAAPIREWKILDLIWPAPSSVLSSDLSDPNWNPLSTIPSFLAIRKLAEFQAYPDTADPATVHWTADLIGRSVWNTRWLLIIPGFYLYDPPSEGIERFINGALVNGARDGNGVSDIKIYLETYGYAGNLGN